MKIVGGPTVAPCKLSTSRGGPLLPLRTRSFRVVPLSHHRRWPHPSYPASQNRFSRFYFQIFDCVIGILLSRSKKRMDSEQPQAQEHPVGMDPN